MTVKIDLSGAWGSASKTKIMDVMADIDKEYKVKMTALESKASEFKTLTTAARDVLNAVQEYDKAKQKESKLFVLKKYTAFQLLYNDYVEKYENLTDKASLERMRDRVLLACETIYVNKKELV